MRNKTHFTNHDKLYKNDNYHMMSQLTLPLQCSSDTLKYSATLKK
jgi:hypothetical protein